MKSLPKFLTPPGRFAALDPIVSTMLANSSDKGITSRTIIVFAIIRFK